MNRRKFLSRFGAALLIIPMLPAPIKAQAMKWREVGTCTFTIITHDDGTVDVTDNKDLVMTKIPWEES